ncbi:angiomotin-like [Watersipora subatra]|uniref:angiomotin-like n=1 Tax=Watersipora subatra TaxID=2589382 RepID=UPI00355BD47C
MQSTNSLPGQRNLEASAPYSRPITGTSQLPTTIGSKNLNGDGDEKLTPREEPQGEESRLQEVFPKVQNSNGNQLLRQQNGREGKQPSIRHKPQSNSVPVPSSQYIRHNVKPLQSRSLDSSTNQSDSVPYALSAPQYRSPPLYGAITPSGKVTTASPVIHCSGNIPHRNGNMLSPYPQVEDSSLPPPPEYPGNRADVRRSYEVLDRMTAPHPSSLSQSSSQPELTNVTSNHVTSSNQGPLPPYSHSVSRDQKLESADEQQDFAAIAARASKMVEILSEENKGLRSELECYYRKVSKLQKFEFELQKIHEAHDNLVRSSVKKEGLEKAIRARQDMDIKQLEQLGLKGQEKVLLLEKALAEQRSVANDLRKLVAQHEETITHLTQITSEQKETVDRSHAKIKSLTAELDNAKAQSNLYLEELEAYKSNASITMEEESEVKMAALTQSTKESERIIYESQAEKLKYMDETHQACKKVALLEAKLKTLQASCAEKDAIVRVLQRRQRCNVSGRGQASPGANSVAQHVRRISEPTNGTKEEVRRPSASEIPEMLDPAADKNLLTQTWQV